MSANVGDKEYKSDISVIIKEKREEMCECCDCGNIKVSVNNFKVLHKYLTL